MNGLQILALSLLAAPALAPAQDGEGPATPPETVTLSLLAGDWSGLPQPGVTVYVEDGVTSRLLTADEGGIMSLEVPDEEATLQLAASAEGQFVWPATLSGFESPWIAPFRIFRRPGDALSAAERQEYARLLPDLYLAEDPPPWLTIPDGVEILRFMPPWREEAAEALTPEDGFSGTANLAVSVLDETGRPVSGQLVRLYVLSEDDGLLYSCGLERTLAEGVAVFSDLPENRWFSVEAPAPGGGTIHSAPVRTGDGSVASFPSLILRPEAETISGFVFDADGPVEHALVASGGEGGQRRLATTTGPSGWFSLGPLLPGDVDIRFIHNDVNGLRRGELAAETGDEVFVPLDILSQEPGPSE